MNTLGLCYDKGVGVEKDLPKAISLYKRAAELGNSQALNNLALCYRCGDSLQKDLSRAF